MQRLLYAVFFLIGLGLVLSSGHSIYLAYQSLHWPSVKATVVRDTCTSDGTSTGMMYRYVDYRYTVQGRQYESIREEFGGHPRSPRCEAHFQPGDNVTAYYDPANPEEVVLKRGGASPAAGKGIFGLVFMAMSWLTYRVTRLRQARRNAVRDGEPGDSAQDGGRSEEAGKQKPPLDVQVLGSLLALGLLLIPLALLVTGLKLIVSGTGMPSVIAGLALLAFSAPFFLAIIVRMFKAFGQKGKD